MIKESKILNVSGLIVASADETEASLQYRALIDQLRSAFAIGCEVPVRHNHRIKNGQEPDATLLLMPSWHGPGLKERYLGVKLVTIYPGNIKKGMPGLVSTYVLYNADTGQQLAILDGNVITGRRTVCASVLAADYLARKDARQLLVVGAGRIANLLPYAYAEIRNLEHIQVWDINPEAAEKLVSKLNGDGFRATQAKSLREAVADADIVTSATLSTEPLIKGAWVKPGTHVDLIGGFTPQMHEADSDLVCRSSVYIDTEEALIEAGDILTPIAEGAFKKSDIRGTLHELCAIDSFARKSPDEITFFKAVGTALADLAAATMVYRKLSSADPAGSL